MTEETIAQSEEAIQMEVGDGSGIPLETETNREDSEISWTKDTKTAPGVINWRALAAEFTWENLWTKRDYKSIGKHFLVSFCTGLFFSGFDIFTDGSSGFTFIFGADYIKNVASPNDTSVADNTSCKNIGRFVVVAEDGAESVDFYQYQCFERDPIWGCWTLAFMFVPGLWAGVIWNGLGIQKVLHGCTHEPNSAPSPVSARLRCCFGATFAPAIVGLGQKRKAIQPDRGRGGRS